MSKIFGYDWQEIKDYQQGKPPAKLVGAPKKEQPTENDHRLLREKGAAWLFEQEMYGVIDRLGLKEQTKE